ncbi:putative Ig domain-containing protein [Streptomyces sp. PSKA54]|uniref:Putative Ig domain-containing protein n=1 Tax=Streptomyces himalayensis subsp. aureolus TaxID=2758039 RepID=A0A7W2D1W8_9ACTN|nr:Ig domain-containing protein [Streptomyces himalayensis]MBA4863255.1 putative Ig domain-containing protein [Streptomyces himalayensis subsp. aureolus]
MAEPQGTGLTRRTVLQAAGATAAAYSLIGAAAGTARADDTPGASDRLVVYPIPTGVPLNTSFSVKARKPGGEWQTVPVVRARTKTINEKTGAGIVRSSSVASLDFSGTVEVEVTSSKGAIGSARIRPLSYDIPHEVSGDTITFSLTEPRNLSIEIGGDIYDNLHLHANPIEAQPEEDDPDVIYFGPGIHTVPNNVVKVPSGKTVYLAGGAVLKARVEFVNVENARLLGRGIIWDSDAATLVAFSKNIEIDGILALNPKTGYSCTIGQSKQVTVRNLHSYSFGQWGDGIDVFSSEDVLIEGVFMRNSDDCIAIYAHRWDYYGDCRNVTVRNSTLWADVAHPVNMGTHGNPDKPEVIENIVFSNIDVLQHREPQVLYQGCFALNPGDRNLIRNVRIQDVRVEDFTWGQLINMRVMANRYNAAPGRGIEDVYVRNLTYDGTHANMAILTGYDADRPIKNLTFQNLAINGTVVYDKMRKPGWYLTTDMVPMFANEHVKDLRFLDAATPASTVAPEITSPDQATAIKNQVFNHLITASALPTSFNAEGLPKGLDIDTATGLISGTAEDNVGSFTVTVSATNSVGTATQTVTLTIQHA